MLSDILPTGLECGVLNGKVDPDDVVAIVGAGPVELATLLTARLYSPAEIIMIDLDDNRLDLARTFGATSAINSADGKAFEAVMALTDRQRRHRHQGGHHPRHTFELCERIITLGSAIANIGVHGTKVDFHLESLWDRNITIATPLVDPPATCGVIMRAPR